MGSILASPFVFTLFWSMVFALTLMNLRGIRLRGWAKNHFWKLSLKAVANPYFSQNIWNHSCFLTFFWDTLYHWFFSWNIFSIFHFRDCLDNVSQRLGLMQPDLFGLKYVSRRSYPKIRWVDLDRPLKKQLDKYSTEPYLFLGVIFYVTDVSLLEDEVGKFHSNKIRFEIDRQIIIGFYGGCKHYHWHCLFLLLLTKQNVCLLFII